MDVAAGRSKIATKFGIVAASQPLAARAGVQMLERGGNAIDAAIAANAVTGVVEPYMNGIGGDLFAVIYLAKTAGLAKTDGLAKTGASAESGGLHGLNSSGWSPKGLTPAVLKRKGLTEMPATGIHTVTVPGAVAGWEAMRSRFGKLPMADILAPAIFYADDGFPVSEIIAAAWAGLAEAGLPGTTDTDLAATYFPNGRAPYAGEVFRNPDLAGSLRRIADKGPAAFYEGKTADRILALSRDEGGMMTAADLREFKPEWVDPVSTTYRGWTVYELPPNTQGIAALLMLDLMEQFPLGEYGFQSVDALHVMIEAKKLAYADMLRYVGDPHFAKMPVGALLDKSYAGKRAKLIDPEKAATCVEPSVFDGLTNSKGGDTIYLSVIDKDGNIVSLIQSIYAPFGSGLVPSGTGFALHNRGALFTLDETHPNALAPRKRPLHTIIPGFMR